MKTHHQVKNAPSRKITKYHMVADTEMKKKKEWSLLVIAHTPKRNLSSPITQNDLAGSR